jgi:hypothetical protein
MIPVEFLIERMGLLIRVDDLVTHLVLKIRYPKKNKQLYFSVDKKTLEMMSIQGYFAYDDVKMTPLHHYMADMIFKIEPGLNKFEIDFEGLEKYFEPKKI